MGKGQKRMRLTYIVTGVLLLLILSILTYNLTTIHSPRSENGEKNSLPEPAFHLKKTTPKKNYFKNNLEGVSLSLQQAQKLSPYPLLKPSDMPFEIKSAYAIVSDEIFGNHDQRVQITYTSSDKNQFLQIDMQNREYGFPASEYEKVGIFKGIKGYFHSSARSASLIWKNNGYTIEIALPNYHKSFTKSDLIKIAQSLKTVK